jgi:hypothetical protein
MNYDVDNASNAAVVRAMSSVADAPVAWALVFDTVTKEEATLETKVTSNPVAEGSPVSDHAYDEQPKLTLTVIMSNVLPYRLNPSHKSLKQLEEDGDVVNSFVVPGNFPTRSQLALAWLDDQRRRHEFCDVQTGLMLYRNMFLTEISYTTDERTAEVLEARLSFVGIRVTRVQVSKYPPRKGKAKKAASKATRRKGEGAAPTVAQQRQAYIERLVSGADGVQFNRDVATKIAYNRYPDAPVVEAH